MLEGMYQFVLRLSNGVHASIRPAGYSARTGWDAPATIWRRSLPKGYRYLSTCACVAQEHGRQAAMAPGREEHGRQAATALGREEHGRQAVMAPGLPKGSVNEIGKIPAPCLRRGRVAGMTAQEEHVSRPC